MALLGFFRRTPPIRTVKDLADFIDEQAAFLMQKGIFEYSRARAGPYANSMLSEPDFQKSVEESRWKAYPLGLAMVGEMVEGVLRPHVGDDQKERRALHDEFIDLVLSVFDRYPVPPQIGEEVWRDARSALALKLDQVSTHPPKRAIDIPEQYAKRYFEMMPIHEDMRSDDEGTTLSFLKLNLVHSQQELIKRMDVASMVAQLRQAESSG
ncbi:MAG: hypothetical protein KJZ73_07590 [Pseudorhodoplanes sp.]|nr:hypothetical protein [Pseudorhodoplanes sp.]MBW7949316.1 hypothetical protein [Pseudorhodoplanes sp.]MCL4711095.1 hypothetical protein [Pseudorhodoplanes sp.]GIK82075.1 MAG: hypothetical protein BroJett024_31800 [Alphaproteobacteria bacterium]